MTEKEKLTAKDITLMIERDMNRQVKKSRQTPLGRLFQKIRNENLDSKRSP